MTTCGIEPTTINHRLAAVSGLFAFRTMRGPAVGNPVPKGREARWVTGAELNGLLGQLATRPKPRFGVAATADCEDVGCRQAATVMRHYMNHRMEQPDIPSIPQFIELIADSDAGMYAFKSVRGPVRAGEARLHPAGPGHHHRR